MDSKAITPIISIILLLMMTVVASTAAYFWMNSIQSNIQESVQGSLESSFSSQLTSFTIVASSCKSESDNITIVLMNTGSVDISGGDLVLSLSSITGSTLDVMIDSAFTGLEASTTKSLELTSTYDIQSGTRYTLRVTTPGGTSMSDSCNAQ